MSDSSSSSYSSRSSSSSSSRSSSCSTSSSGPSAHKLKKQLKKAKRLKKSKKSKKKSRDTKRAHSAKTNHDRLVDKFEDPNRIVKVTSLPSRSQMPTLKETLYDEFVKYGKIISIRLDADKKCCFIFFKHSSEAQTAVDSLNEKPFNSLAVLKCQKIDFSTYLSQHSQQNVSQHTLVQSLNQEQELDEYCAKATRTLYIGNLDREVKHSDLRQKLDKKYGDIIEIEIKKDVKKSSSLSSSATCSLSSSSALASSPYAFIQFSDIKSVIKAMRCMNGKCINQNLIKLGFGKSKPTKTLWLDGISDQLKESHLKEFFRAHCDNAVEQILIDRNKCQALVYFSVVEDAKNCAERIRAKRFYDKKIMVDFASKEFISSRFEHLLDPKHHLFTNHNRLKSADPKSKRARSPRSNSLNDSRSSSSSSSSSTSSSASTEATPNTTPAESVDSAAIKIDDDDKKRHYYDDQYPIDDLSHVLNSNSQKYKFYAPSSSRNQHSPSDLSHLLNGSPGHYRRYFNESTAYHHHHRHYYDDRLYRQKYYGYHVDKSSSSTSLNPSAYSKSNKETAHTTRHKSKADRKKKKKMKKTKNGKVSSSSSRSSLEGAKKKLSRSRSRSASSDSSSSAISSVSNASSSSKKTAKKKCDRDDINPQPMDVETPDESDKVRTSSQSNTPHVHPNTAKAHSLLIPLESNVTAVCKDPRCKGTDSHSAYIEALQFGHEIEIPKFALKKSRKNGADSTKKEKVLSESVEETSAETKIVSPSHVDVLDRRSLEERIKMLDEMMEQQKSKQQISNDLSSTTGSLIHKFSSLHSATPAVLKQPVRKLSKLFDADQQRLNQSSTFLSQKLANSPYFAKAEAIGVNLAPAGVAVYDHIKPLICQMNKSPKLILPNANPIVAHNCPSPSTPTSVQIAEKLGLKIKGCSSMLNFATDLPTVSAIASTSSSNVSSSFISTPSSPPLKTKDIKSEPVQQSLNQNALVRSEFVEEKKILIQAKIEPECETKIHTKIDGNSMPKSVTKTDCQSAINTHSKSEANLDKIKSISEPKIEVKTYNKIEQNTEHHVQIKDEKTSDLKNNNSKIDASKNKTKIDSNNETKNKMEIGAESKVHTSPDQAKIQDKLESESKTLSKTILNAEPKTQSKSENEPKCQTKTNLNDVPKIQSKSENESKCQTKTNLNAESKTQSKAENEAKCQTKTNLNAEPKTQSKAENEAKCPTKTNFNAESKTQNKAENEPKCQTKTNLNDVPKIQSKAENESKCQTKTNLNADSKTQIKAENESKCQSNSDLASEAKNNCKTPVQSEYKVQNKSDVHSDSRNKSEGTSQVLKAQSKTDVNSESKNHAKCETTESKHNEKSKNFSSKSLVKKPEIKSLNCVKNSLKDKETKSPLKSSTCDKTTIKSGDKANANKSVSKPIQSAKKVVGVVKKEIKSDAKVAVKSESKNVHKTDAKIDEQRKKESSKKNTDLNDLYDSEESDTQSKSKSKDKHDKKSLLFKKKIDSNDKKSFIKKNINDVKTKANKVSVKKTKEETRSKCDSSSNDSSESSSESDSSDSSGESSESEDRQQKIKTHRSDKKKSAKKEKRLIVKKKSHQSDSSENDEHTRKIKKKKSSSGINRELAFLIENKDALVYSGSLYDRVKARPRQSDTKKKKRKNKKSRKIVVQSDHDDSSKAESSESESSESSSSSCESDTKSKLKNRIQSSDSDSATKKCETSRKRQKSTDSLFDSEETVDSKKDQNKSSVKPNHNSLIKRCRTDSTTSSTSSTRTMGHELSAKKRKLPDEEAAETNPCKTPKSSVSSTKSLVKSESVKSVKTNLELKMKKAPPVAKAETKSELKPKLEVKKEIKKEASVRPVSSSISKFNKIKTEIKSEKIEPKKSSAIKKEVKKSTSNSDKSQPTKETKIKDSDSVKTSLSSESSSSIGHCMDEESLTLTTMIKHSETVCQQNVEKNEYLEQKVVRDEEKSAADEAMTSDVKSLETISEAKELETVDEIKPLKTISEVKEMETISEAKEMKTIIEVKEIETISEAKEMKTISEAKEMKTIIEVKEMETISEAKELETVDEIKPLKTTSEVKEMETISEVKEMETISEVKEMKTVDSIEPLENIYELNQSETVEEIKASQSICETNQLETMDDVRPLEAICEQNEEGNNRTEEKLEVNYFEMNDENKMEVKDDSQEKSEEKQVEINCEASTEPKQSEPDEPVIKQEEEKQTEELKVELMETENLPQEKISEQTQPNEISHMKIEKKEHSDVDTTYQLCSSPKPQPVAESVALEEINTLKNEPEPPAEPASEPIAESTLDSTQDYSSETIEMDETHVPAVESENIENDAVQMINQDTGHNESKNEEDLLKIEPSLTLLKHEMAQNEPMLQIKEQHQPEMDYKKENLTKNDMDIGLNQTGMLLPTVSPNTIQFNPTQMDLNSAMSLTASLNNLTESKQPEETHLEETSQEKFNVDSVQESSSAHNTKNSAPKSSSSKMDMLLEAIMVDQPKVETEKKSEKNHHHHHRHHHNHHHHKQHKPDDKQDKTEKQANAATESTINFGNYIPPNFGSFMGSPSTPQKNSFTYSMPFILGNTPAKTKEEPQQPTTPQSSFSIQSHLKRNSPPAAQARPFVQPPVPNLNSLDNWQAAYTKYPLTFLAPPPQFQQQQQQQQQPQLTNKAKQSPSPSPSPKVTTPKPLPTTPIPASETNIFPGYEYLDKMHLLLPAAAAQVPFNPLVNASINPRPVNSQQSLKPPIQNMSVTSTTPKPASVKPGKKQIAKEYEQQQQQQLQQQQTPSQILPPNSLPHFPPFSTAQTAANNPSFSNYYSPFNDPRFPLLFAAAAAHNQFPDLTNTQPNQPQAQNSTNQPNFKPNMDYMSQMMMSSFPNVYSDNRQSNQFGNFLSSQFNQLNQNACLNQEQKRDESSLFTGYTEFQDRNNIIWYGSFTIKNDTASIGMNFVAGNLDIAKSCLGQMSLESNNTPLRILQRMRLEQSQLEGVQRKLQLENEHCILIAVPYGANMLEQMKQTNNLKNGFINYLLEKKAAGIVNVNVPNTSYVVHIFPPCDFTNEIMKKRAPEMSKKLGDYTHLFIVIATV